MFKTFDDFVGRAVQKYHLPFDVAKRFIKNKLQAKGLSSLDIICYINWADNDCLTTRQLGKKLDISFQAVHQHLQRVQKIWPHLFNFGPKIPRFNTRRSDRKKSGGTMGRLQVDVSNDAQKF